MTQREEKVREYPHLSKIDRAFVVNNNDVEYHRALARRKADKERRHLVQRVDSLERKLDQVIALLTRGQ